MAEVCPSITAGDISKYKKQLANVAIANRLHLDFTDGFFSIHRTVRIDEVQLPPHKLVDLHLMFKNPAAVIDDVIQRHPHLVIIHAEAEGNLLEILKELHARKIKAGIALLHDTRVSSCRQLIENADHVLIFEGDLGKFGGKADLTRLKKVRQIRKIHQDVEIGWDGGVNDSNATQLLKGGIDVLISGGFIQESQNPGKAYAILQQIAHRFEITYR